MFCWLCNAPLHECTNCCWRSVENRDLVFLNDLPHAVVARKVGNTFVHHLCCAVTQWSVHDVTVTRNPANVSCTPVDVFLGIEVEHILMRVGHVSEVAACGVHDALGLTRGARGVQQKQQLLRIHWFRWARIICRCHELVIPVVTTSLHLHGIIAALHHHNTGDCCRVVHRFICLRLQWEHFTAAVSTICSDQNLCFSVVDAISKSLR